MGDNFSQECTNCAACIAVCPTQAMTFVLKPTDYPVQGSGHLGRRYHREQDKFILDGNAEDKGDNSINQGAA
jgi:ferredoxin